ncbi:MAG TPA: DNA polymerase III subunit gamma/tau [Chitinophagaceae bacterium]|nr:DNA polymerase III subunit gamma/tau [Chitinophagaceae bacterium]
MDKFIVSARKYRPQTFATVVGQAHITTTLKNAIRHNQLAHAFLFCGPRGVGKTTCARILAKTINCENQTPEGEACNQCGSCLSFNEGTSLNIHELDAASNNSVDDIRTLVEQVRFAPQAGKYKVYIIDEVHMLSSAAFNAFLKTLEEPPSYAIFILATTEKHKILPTILSRCQIFDFKRITTADTVEHLQEICDKEQIHADKASLQLIAQKSEGCMRDALSILDKIVSFTSGEVSYQNTLEHLNILDADYYFRLIDCMLRQDLAGAMLLYDDINRKGFEGDMVLNGFAEFVRNLLVCKDERVGELLDVVEGFRDRYIQAARSIPAAYLISALNLLGEAELNYKAARNKRLHVELALIKLCYLHQALEVVAEPGGLGKKKLIESAKPIGFRRIAPMEYVTPGKKAGSTPQPEPGSPAPDTGSARLLIDSTLAAPGAQPKPAAAGPAMTASAAAAPGTNGPAATATTSAGTPRLSALSKIREQFRDPGTPAADQASHPLQAEPLQEAWKRYVQQLKEAKNSAAQSFELATLRIRDENSFEVLTANNLEYKFIEKERVHASEFLQQALRNRNLQFAILIEEKSDARPVQDLPLTSREQYLKMTESFPLVRELKDRLRLELDY